MRMCIERPMGEIQRIKYAACELLSYRKDILVVITAFVIAVFVLFVEDDMTATIYKKE